jgi:predicted negative regulator of RcsB-dependent stress response
MKKRIAALIALNPPLAFAIIAGTLCLIVLAGVLTWSFWHSDSKNETKADEARVETIAADADLDVANKNLETASKGEKAASKKAAEARKPLQPSKKRVEAAKEKVKEAIQPTANVNYAEAQRLRCLAYPQDAQCR